MLKLLIFLLYQVSKFKCRQFFVTFNRLACFWDQSNCDGSKIRPFSNMIIAFKKGLFLESIEHTGSLEFFLEAGSHTILPIIDSEADKGSDGVKKKEREKVIENNKPQNLYSS
jgi:hypothetical protein